jgi:hypothetical protein
VKWQERLSSYVEPAAEGGYTAQALGYSIYTEADTWAELKAAVQDAIQCHFDDVERPHRFSAMPFQS